MNNDINNEIKLENTDSINTPRPYPENMSGSDPQPDILIPSAAPVTELGYAGPTPPDSVATNGVYAGPPLNPGFRPEDISPMMCVYAGPDFMPFNRFHNSTKEKTFSMFNANDSQASSAPTDNTNAFDSSKFCPMCGFKRTGGKFCSECGYKFSDGDGQLC